MEYGIDHNGIAVGELSIHGNVGPNRCFRQLMVSFNGFPNTSTLSFSRDTAKGQQYNLFIQIQKVAFLSLAF